MVARKPKAPVWKNAAGFYFRRDEAGKIIIRGETHLKEYQSISEFIEELQKWEPLYINDSGTVGIDTEYGQYDMNTTYISIYGERYATEDETQRILVDERRADKQEAERLARIEKRERDEFERLQKKYGKK